MIVKPQNRIWGVGGGLLVCALALCLGPGGGSARAQGTPAPPRPASSHAVPVDSLPGRVASGDSARARAVADAVTAAAAQGFWAARRDTASPEGWTRGPLYRLRHVETLDERGAPLARFSPAEWAGEAASRDRLTALQAAAQKQLARDGFVFAEIRTRLRPDTLGAPATDVTLEVRRGAAYKLGQPLVRGTRTRPDVVRRLALWSEGENYDPARIERGMSRLGRLGYYESVAWAGLFRDSVRNVLYPALNLRDARANTLGGLLGYDTEADDGGRLTGFLDVHLVNIRGTARDFMFAFDGRTGREREARAAYTEPWILGLPVGARWEGRFLQQDTLFWEWQHGLFVFRDLDFTSRVEAEFGAQANRDQISETGSSALLSGVRVAYDDRDRVPFTRRGVRGHAGVTGLRRTLDAGEGGGATDSIYYLAQVRLALEHWQPLSERLGLKLGGAAATNVPLTRLNPGELHDVGGARSLRGYRERQFQTNAYALADIELQFMVGRRGRVFGFASPGVVNRPVGRYDPRRVLGYGAGLEVSQGDWSVALTYALNPERPVGDGYLHAAVENRF